MMRSSHLLAFIDIETTGHTPLKRVNGLLRQWHEIIDLAVVLVHPGRYLVFDECQWKIQPKHPERCLPDLINQYPKRAASGEWDTAVSAGSAMNRLLGFLEPWTKTNPVVPGGQNFFFDWSFLAVAFAMAGYDMEKDVARVLHYSRFDTRSMAIQELREPGTPFDPADWSIRNEELVRRLGIEPEPPVHTAINGARKSFEVWQKLEDMKRARFAK